ncbi:anosmin-1 [Hyposmocoma kahamanoa]|uniref:anosmin-1 n=1 Tax=Hyposmocoma kahamanoa TaxID=1477025 RepID=UPI000E6D8C7A|nr:anosmin-1 [Hyposmocoma kahamanoa]
MTKMRIKMQVQLFIVLMVVLMPVLCITKKLARFQGDPLSKIRCDLMCWDVVKDVRPQCRTQCKFQQQKPGTCPMPDNSRWANACVEACNLDGQCDGTQKCCKLRCGSSCSEPVDLLTLSGLPALPVIEEPKEKRRSVIIKWSDGVGDAARAVPGRVLYLLEEQHHLGPKYEEARLGTWNLLLRTNKTKVSLRNLLKPGRWYRFRVAAVSAAGTRGFSEPSAPFTPRRGPRPPSPPKKLRVRPIRSENGTVTVRLEWREPRSDLPVMRYKVFWSRRVQGLGGELDSVLVNHQSVSKEKKFIEIKDLQPSSLYFFQVQTISQFGVGKLRSEKSAIFFNTTKSNEILPESLQRHEGKITGLKLHKIIWYNRKLKGKISWDPLRNTDRQQRYYVNWRTIQCENKETPQKDLSAITEQTTFDIYELEYKCNYKINVNRAWKPKYPDSELHITVPGCQYFQQKVNNTICNY